MKVVGRSSPVTHEAQRRLGTDIFMTKCGLTLESPNVQVLFESTETECVICFPEQATWAYAIMDCEAEHLRSFLIQFDQQGCELVSATRYVEADGKVMFNCIFKRPAEQAAK